MDRLNRCVLSTGQCQVLSRHNKSFRRTFRTFIDSNDQVFLSDSASGKVTWLDSDCSVLDELSLETLAGNLVATDYRNMRVLRFGPDSSALDDLSSPEQERYITELENQADFYNTSSALAWTLFGVLRVGGMIYGIRQELRRVNAQ